MPNWSNAQLRVWYEQVLLPECFADGGGYWGKQMAQNAEWTVDTPARLLFDLAVNPATATTEPHPTDSSARRITGGELVPLALVNEPLEFWDAVFGGMLVFGARLWPNAKQLAKSVKREMARWGWPCQAYQNMRPATFAWIQDLARGRETIRILEDPLKWTLVIDLKLYFRQLTGGFPGLETGNDEHDSKNREFIEQRIEKIGAEFERLIGEIKV